MAFAIESHSLPVGLFGSLKLIHQAVLGSGWSIDSIKFTQEGADDWVARGYFGVIS